ncbi:hypothetical protein Tco_1409909 [Tanacetum coccineum]
MILILSSSLVVDETNDPYWKWDSILLFIWFERTSIRCRFQQNPNEVHWTTVKTILKFLRNTKDVVLVYGVKPKAELKVSCYADAGFQTDKDDTKSYS